MNSSRRTVVRQSLLYVGGAALQRGTMLVLLPILIALLSPEDFARLGLLTAATAVLIPLFSQGVHSAVTRLYFDYSGTDDCRSLLRTSMAWAVGVVALGGAAAGLLAWHLGQRDPLARGDVRILSAAWLLLVGTTLMQFGEAASRAMASAERYAILTAAQAIGLAGSWFWLVPTSTNNYLAIVLAFSVAAGIGGAATLGVFWPHIGFGRLRRDMLWDLISFGTPAAIHVIALWLIGTSGRWVGGLILPIQDLAAFTVLSLVINGSGMIARALFHARMGEVGAIFASGRPREGDRVLVATMRVVVIITCVLFLFAAVGVWILGKTSPDAYLPSPVALALGWTAACADVIYLRAVNGMFSLKRTGRQAAATVVSGVLGVAASAAFATVWGEIGLSIGLTCGFVLLAITSNLQYQAATKAVWDTPA